MIVTAVVEPSSYGVRLTATGYTGVVSWWRSEARDVFIGDGPIVEDRSAPLNQELTYYAVDDVTSVTATVVSVTAVNPVLASTMSGAAYPVTVVSFRPYQGQGNSVWHPIIGRSDPFVSVFPATFPSGTLTIRCAGNDERFAMIDLLRSGEPLRLRSTCPDRLDSMVFLMTSWSDPFQSDTMREGATFLEIQFQRVTDVEPAYSPPARTYQDVLSGSPTYQEVVDKYATYQALLDGVALSPGVPVPSDDYGVPAGTVLTKLTTANNPYPGNTFTGSSVYKINVAGTFTGWKFEHRVEVYAGNVSFVNCQFGGAAGSTTAAVALLAGITTGTGVITADRCTFKPDVPYDGIDGLRGCRMTITACEITGTVDGMQLWGAGAVTIQDSWIHDLIWYDNDSHADGTHNDGAQISQGTGYTFSNNLFSGTMYNAGMFISQSLGPTTNVHIVGNHFDIFDDDADINLNDAAGAAAMTGTWIQNNSFRHDTSKYQMLVSTRVRDHPSTVIWGNVWDDGSLPPPAVTGGAL